MSNVILCSDLTLGFGSRVVLNGANLAIAEGEFIGVLGPNGAGKTTLMRAILGLLPPRSGSILVFGKPPPRGNPAIGYLPQLRSRLAGLSLTGRDFIAAAYGGHRFGLPLFGKAAEAAVDRALALVEAENLASRPLAALSGGEQQRLLLAQALLGRPRLLLLDEPLISLDPPHQASVVALVRRLQKELGFTVLFSAHELNPLLHAIDRVLYLGGGQAALGTVEEVITPAVLSRLYRTEIEVIRAHGHIFVMAGGYDVEHEAHRHAAGHSDA